MFIGETNIQSIKQLIQALKEYLEMQKEYTRLELTEKLTILFSTLIFIIILIVLGILVLFYLSFSLIYFLAPYVGGLLISYALMAGVILLFIFLIAVFRKKLIYDPMANFMAQLFLKKPQK